MKSIYLFLLFSITTSSILAQEYFVKRIDFDDEANTPKSILEYNNRYYILVNHFCENLECSSLVEINYDADTLHRTFIPELDVAFESIIIHNDSITIVGNNDPANTHFRMAHFDLDGNKISETMEIFHPIESFTSAFQLTFQKIGNRFFIMGVAEREGDSHALCYKVDNEGNLDTLVVLAKAGRAATARDSEVDDEGNLITFHRMEESFNSRHWIRINKYNHNLDSIWTYESEDFTEYLSGTNGALLDGKEIAFKSFDPNNNSQLESLRVINEEKEERIFYLPPDLPTNLRRFARIKVLSNGDILGLGGFQDVTIDPEVHTAPWMIRLSPDGEIRWQRVFYELDPTDNESRFGVVRDVIELPNGDLYGVGDMRYGFTTTFVFKVDSNGCLNPDDCGLLNFITDTSEPAIGIPIAVFPNPAMDHFSIRTENASRNFDFAIIDAMGQVVSRTRPLQGTEIIDTYGLTTGLYYVLLFDNGLLVGRQQVLVE